MSKQDRQGARTVADLERKYNPKKSFAAVMGVAKGAERKADEAAALDEKLTSEEIFNRLTNNGTWEGLYRDEETGEVYINANYIKSGTVNADRIDGSSLNITGGSTIGSWKVCDEYLLGESNDGSRSVRLYPGGVFYGIADSQEIGYFFLVFYYDGKPVAGLSTNGWKEITTDIPGVEV